MAVNSFWWFGDVRAVVLSQLHIVKSLAADDIWVLLYSLFKWWDTTRKFWGPVLKLCYRPLQFKEKKSKILVYDKIVVLYNKLNMYKNGFFRVSLIMGFCAIDRFTNANRRPCLCIVFLVLWCPCSSWEVIRHHLSRWSWLN